MNNEVGTVSDVAGIARLCTKRGIAIHSDLTQAIGKTLIDVHEMGLDFASCSAHKIYGPKGVGAAFIKSDAYGIPPITALMHGGEQEHGFRAGTLAVHNIVGFGKAAEIAIRDFDANETTDFSTGSETCGWIKQYGRYFTDKSIKEEITGNYQCYSQ